MHIENMHRMMEEISSYMCRHSDDNGNVAIMAQAADMLKDLACATKECEEAAYYRSVTDAMDRYGRDGRMGYRPDMRHGRGMSRMDMPDMYLDPRYDETPDGQRINHRAVDDRPGYSPDWRSASMPDPDYDDRYGRTFNEYRRAKRHYTETHSDSDKMKMRDSTNAHMMETMATLREMFDDADPELKKRMKADMVKLTGEMSV